MLTCPELGCEIAKGGMCAQTRATDPCERALFRPDERATVEDEIARELAATQAPRSQPARPEADLQVQPGRPLHPGSELGLDDVAAPQAIACVEIGAGQAADAGALFAACGWKSETFRDLGDRDRCLVLRR